MAEVSRFRNPVRPAVFGAASVLLMLEFWLHVFVPFWRENVRTPLWPWGALIELSLSAIFGVFASVRGSRLWWVVVLCAAESIGFLFFALSG